jgi:hypothetical protein
MKHLTVLSFVIGLLGAPIHAQAQQSIPGSPEGFNGLVWDPPGYAAVERYTAPDVGGQAVTFHARRNHSRSGM